MTRPLTFPPSGPLAPELYDTARAVGSWWEASLPPEPPREALTGDCETDVAIIGGGFAGLNAAKTLAEAGVGATVLDAGAVGWGASGRNGGICGPGGDKLTTATLLRRYGAEGVAAYEAAQTEAIEWVRAFALAEGLGAWMQGDGELLLAHSGRRARELATLAQADREHYAPLPPSGQDDIARHGGVMVKPAFGIHPLAYVRSLARATERAGATVFERSCVTRWSREGRRHRLETATGSLSAERLLIATNGFTPGELDPRLSGLAIPVISNIGVTRPLTAEERARHPWLGERPASDTRNLLSYFRVLPDGRFLLGARGDTRGSDAGAKRMRAAVAERIRRELPGFAEAEITHFWRGPIAATMRLTPAIGWLDRKAQVAIALGWHGSGVALASLGGRLAAELLMTGRDDHIPLPMRGRPPRLPLPGLTPLWVGTMMTFYRALDALSSLPSRNA
ncbi:MAG: FAD-binding oxidoreductase [Pseudomonadota bacterium]